jgi:hypothetical protein
MFMNNYSNLKVGDLLYRPKGPVEHAGVYLGTGQVLHIQPGGLAVTAPFTDYSKGKLVAVRRLKIQLKEGFKTRLAEVVQSNASYSLLSNNCEHIAYYLTTGERMSPQLQAALALGFAGSLLAAQGKLSSFIALAGAFGIGGILLSNASRQYDFFLPGKTVTDPFSERLPD